MTNIVVARREEMPAFPLTQLEPGATFCTDQPFTVDEFYEMVNEDTNAELVEGVIVMKSPVSYQHEALFDFLYTMLNLYTKEQELGQVLGSRTAVRITNHTAREPDLLFVSRERLGIIHKNDIQGPPDLAVEIVSPWDSPREIVAKQSEYEQIGVREFWLIDQPKQQIFIYDLDSKGSFCKRQIQEGVICSTTVKGFKIKLEWLWCKPGNFPKILRIVQELLGNSGG